jgi:predicted kinase
MDPLKLIVLVGPAGCGKTTWAKIYLKDHRARRVNRDSFRAMSDAFVRPEHSESRYVESDEAVYAGLRDYAIEHWLCRGYDVIVDDTNLTPDIFPHMCAIADRINAYVEVSEKIIKIDHELCAHNNANRPEAIPYQAWNEQWLLYRAHNENMPYLSMPYSFRRDAYYGEYKISTLPRAILVDLDNTIAMHTPEREIYDHSMIPTDVPNIALADVLFSLWNNEKIKIIIISGRNEEAREDTKTWLAEHEIVHDALFMRPVDKPKDDSYIIKKEIYEREVKNKYFPIAVFEDVERDITLWRDLNLPVYQVGGENINQNENHKY